MSIFRKTTAILAAATLMLGGILTTPEVQGGDVTKGTYGSLEYCDYGDYITITGCDTSVIDLEIPAEIDGIPVTGILKDAFYNRQLESVSLPDTLTSVGANAFFGTPWFKKRNVDVPYVTEDGVLLAANNKLCTGDVVIPEGVRVIADDAFDFCYGMRSVILPDSVAYIGESAFSTCLYLETVTLSESLTAVSRDMFYGCTSLTSIDIPESVSEIQATAFSGCTDLEEVILSEGIISIGDQAFEDCTSLSTISIPVSVAEIGKYAFPADSMTDIYYAGTTDEWKQITIGANETLFKKVYIHCSDGIIEPIRETTDASWWDYIASTTTMGTTTMEYCNWVPDWYTTTTTAETTTFLYCDTAPSTTTTTTTTITETTELILGDVNGDNIIDAADAAEILKEAVLRGTGGGAFSAAQIAAGDINKDNQIDASDAAIILSYAAAVGAGETDADIMDFS